MKTEHTPGPWDFKYDDDSKTGLQVISKDEIIVDWVGGNNLYEAEANARIIAAAPELLEALECILNAHRLEGRIDKGYFEEAYKAIKKAKGQ